MAELLAAAPLATANTTVFAAFAVGFISFISPCVLPLVPGYLSAVSGVTVGQLQGEEELPLAKVLAPAIIFCLSFTLVFVAFGLGASGIGATLQDHKQTFQRVSGVLIVLMGLFFLLTPFVPFLNREFRPEALIRRAGSGGPLIAGAAFAVAWTPCIGPTLGSIIVLASNSDSVGRGGILLACYSLGLAVPFLVTAVAFNRATTVFRWMRDRYLIVTAVSGVILIVMGVLIYSDELTRLNASAQDWLGGLGLDWIYTL